MISNVVKVDLEYVVVMWLFIFLMVWMCCLFLRVVWRIWKFVKVIIINGKKILKNNNSFCKILVNVYVFKFLFVKNDVL